MRRLAVEKILRIKDLRRQGSSIGEIVKELGLYKTTVWYHSKDIVLNADQVRRNSGKKGGKAEHSRREWVDAEEHAKEILGGSAREISMTAAMLYWAEGSKRACEFINSDGAMIVQYVSFLRKVLGITSEQLQGTIRYFTGMEKEECLLYWSNLTGFPREEFIVRFNDGGTRSNTKHGMCRITVKRGGKVLKLLKCLWMESSEQMTRATNEGIFKSEPL
ncbi:MAG: hypothetical protein WCJ29_04820 [bacterium]